MPGLEELFRCHPRLRAVIDAALEGNQGSIRTEGDPPTAARIDLGCYAVPAGDPESPSARALLQDLAGPLEIVVPDDDRWRRLITDVFGGRVWDRSMRAFVGESLDLAKLQGIASSLAPGYEVSPVGVREASAFDAGLTPHGIEVFGGPERFAQEGFGVCALSGGRPVSAATTYALSSDKAEVAVTTREDHRGRGLAAAVSAAMLAECVGRGVVPHWNAFNPVSQRLALRLGLTPAGTCEALMLDGPKVDPPDPND